MAIRSLKTGSFSRSLLVGNSYYIPPSFESIATVTVGAGGASSIDFSSIPSTYTHLQIRGIVRQSYSGAGGANLVYRFNNDPLTNGDTSSSNYVGHYLYGNSAPTISSGISNRNYCADSLHNGNTSGIFAAFIMDVLDYTSTNKYKTFKTLSGDDRYGSGQVTLWSGFWKNTSAINQITYYCDPTYSFVQYSQIALYGIKG